MMSMRKAQVGEERASSWEEPDDCFEHDYDLVQYDESDRRASDDYERYLDRLGG